MNINQSKVLMNILLISSTEKIVVLYQKHNEKFWLRSDYITGESFHLNSLDFDINIDELYQGVEFEETE